MGSPKTEFRELSNSQGGTLTKILVFGRKLGFDKSQISKSEEGVKKSSENFFDPLRPSNSVVWGI